MPIPEFLLKGTELPLPKAFKDDETSMPAPFKINRETGKSEPINPYDLEAYIQMGDGQVFDINPEISKDDANTLIQKILIAKNGVPFTAIQIPGFKGNITPATQSIIPTLQGTGAPGPGGLLVGPGKITPQQTVKQGTDLTANIAGGTAGSFAPYPVVSSGLGAVAAQKLVGDPFQRLHTDLKTGKRLRPIDKDEVKEFSVAAGGEALGRAGFALGRGAKWLARAGGSTKQATRTVEKLASVGIDIPRLDQALKGTDAWGLYDMAFKQLKQHPGSTRLLNQAIAKDSERMALKFLEDFYVPYGDELIIPDTTMVGDALLKGKQRVIVEEYGALVDSAYGQLRAKIPPTRKYSWEPIRRAVDEISPGDPFLREWGSPEIRRWMGDALKGYSEEVVGPDGVSSVVFLDVPYEKIHKLRRLVDNKINWASLSAKTDVNVQDLLKFRDGITEAMEAAATREGATAEFEVANTLAKTRAKIRDEVFAKIDKKVGSRKVGDAVDSLVNSNDYRPLENIRAQLGADSEEWLTVRGHAFAKLAIGSDGEWSLPYLMKRVGKISPRSGNQAMLDTLLGRDTVARKNFNNFIDVYGVFGTDLTKQSGALNNWWTRSRLMGPAALGGLGGFNMFKDEQGRGSAGGAVAGGLVMAGLATLSAHTAARLLLSPVFTGWATRAANMTFEQFGGHIGRLTAQMATASPSERQATAEFLGMMGQMTNVPQGGNTVDPKGLLGGR